jgi:hypothetical protein
MGIGIGQRGFIGGLSHPQVTKLSKTTRQSATDFTQTFSLSELTKKHGYKMIPAAEAFSVPFGLMAENQIEKVTSMKQSNQLTEQACMAYHLFASFVWLTVSFGD